MNINKITSLFYSSNSINKVDKHNLKYIFSNISTRNKNDEFIITTLETPNGSFKDLRTLGKGASFRFGKSELNVDTLGNVVSYKKPFYKSLKKLVNNSQELASFIAQNINDNQLVKKKTVSLLTFPKNVIEKLKKATV